MHPYIHALVADKWKAASIREIESLEAEADFVAAVEDVYTKVKIMVANPEEASLPGYVHIAQVPVRRRDRSRSFDIGSLEVWIGTKCITLVPDFEAKTLQLVWSSDVQHYTLHRVRCSWEAINYPEYPNVEKFDPTPDAIATLLGKLVNPRTSR